jgi:hypothetical protein
VRRAARNGPRAGWPSECTRAARRRGDRRRGHHVAVEPRGWLLVTRQGELETALCEFDPSDAFVREASAVAPTNLLADGWVEAPGAPADVRIVILAPTGSIPGVELHLHEAQNVSVDSIRHGHPPDSHGHSHRDRAFTLELHASDAWPSTAVASTES